MVKLSVLGYESKIGKYEKNVNTNRDSLDRGHPEEKTRMGPHANHFGYDGNSRPVHAEKLGQFLEIDSGGFPNAIHRITQPRHTQVA